MSERPLRIAMLTTFYPPYNFGGDGIAIQRLSRSLVRRGHHVTVLHDADAYNALAPEADPPEPDASDGVERIAIRSRFGTLSTLLTQQLGTPVMTKGRIESVLDEGRFDVLHYNNVSLIGGPGLLSLGTGLKVYEAHEHWLVCPSHVLWRHNRELCTERQCLRCVVSYRRPPQAWRSTDMLDRKLDEIDVLIAKSEFSREKHREFGLRHDMEVLPYFLPDMEPTEARGGESPHERPYFLFVGRLERIKGLDDVIPLFETYEDADLVIAGDGNDRDRLERLAAGNPRVRFLGRLDPEALGRYYASAISLIVPSICYETFGIILIESFRQRTPVIARRLGPFPEIVEACKGGELFSTPEELLDAMRKMQSDPGYRDSCARQAAAGFAANWSESVVVPRYLELLASAAERGGRAEIARAARTAA